MTNEEFNQFCKNLPATTYVVQWNNSHVWKVGGKVFAISGLGKQPTQNGSNKGDVPAITFKTSTLNFDFLSDKSGYIPAPYFASRGMKWIQCIECHAELDEELAYYLQESHRLVSLGLTKKMQQELGLNQAH
ncbi:MmcQ/YjbR family DNA-binding protein [Vibrio methylphosphonaticus]|uniref:MmcQ/YjbR family DNA-binding protein n=1 Tax=Vibrio methylphosphonaticus TaxID=2946866 RepID=UPI00202A1287|nr:MmcQ/YjbR family DNA-binding protein [Vibrio methylphosphonaticus]MCL9773794.1 MmcQ/YjbR family DNA-binding protein [Vibrio methylphosphonaticus]